MTIHRNKIPAFAADLEEVVVEAMEDGANAVAQEAKARVPVSEGPGHHLRDAIHVERVVGEGGHPERHVVAGDSQAWYGHIVEGGAVTGQSARPFLVPAFERHKLDIQKRIAAALKMRAERK